MGRFAGAVSVITGAGSGIGESAAKRMAAEGSRVVLVGRTESKLKKVAEEINQHPHQPMDETEVKAAYFVADVTKEEDLQALASFVDEQYGALHVLINNAGGSKQSSILEMKEEDWDHVQAVNLKSVFLVSKVLGRIMVDSATRESEESHTNRSIINIASLSGYKAGAIIPHYSAAKAGVINFSRALANELAPYGIRVNSISPGFVETPLTERGLQNTNFSEAIKRNTALKRVGRPEEIANVIAFVASSEASYMTGSDVLVDGGWLIT